MLSLICLAMSLLCASQGTYPKLAAAPTIEATPVETSELRPQRLLVHGGVIYLGNKDSGVVEALLIEGGRILASGPLMGLGVDMDEPGLSTLDLRGAVAVPGLQDSNGHMGWFGESMNQVDLRSATSFEEVIALLSAAAKDCPVGEWIVGWGWDQESWGSREFPTHEALSDALRSHPVLLHRIDRDAVLVNEVVLKRAGLADIQDQLVRMPGGLVVLNEELMATGLFLGNAQELVTKLLPELTDDQTEQHLLAAQQELLKQGVTCVHDMGASPRQLRAYLRLRERGLMKLRIVAYMDGNKGLMDPIFEDMPFPPDSEGLLRISGVSFRLDGSLGSWGAALQHDYEDKPGERGRMLLTETELTRLVHRAWSAGLQPAVHAVGDAATRAAMDAYEGMERVDEDFSSLRPRIEQAQLVSHRKFREFPRLGVIPSMQPTMSTGQTPLLLKRLGEQRTQSSETWRSQAPDWTEIAFGSGFPAASPAPLEGLLAARTQRLLEVFNSDEALKAKFLSGGDVLAAFTRGAAYAAHQDSDRGQLLPGYWADLTIFDMDPVEGDTDTILKGHVMMTMINGNMVYSR